MGFFHDIGVIKMISKSIFQRDLEGLSYKERVQIWLKEKDLEIEELDLELEEKELKLDEKVLKLKKSNLVLERENLKLKWRDLKLAGNDKGLKDVGLKLAENAVELGIVDLKLVGEC